MPIVKYKTNGNWVAVPTSGAIATDTTYGYVKIATAADVAAGTDNSAAITAKQLKDYSDENFVHLTGNEDINGSKTFIGTFHKKGSYTVGTLPSANQYNALNLSDSSGTDFGSVTQEYKSDGSLSTYIGTRKQDGSSNYNILGVGYDANSLPMTYTFTPSATNSTSDTNIANVAWVNDPTKSTNVVHRTGDEEIAGTKTFTSVPNIKISNADITVTPSSLILNDIKFYDVNNIELARFGERRETNGDQVAEVVAQNKISGTLCKGFFKSVVDSSGNAFVRFDTDATSNLSRTANETGTSSTIIPTMGWVNDATSGVNNVVHKTGDETIGGTKTFSDTIQGTAYRALWGDLAEYYLTDEQYSKGTLVQFGGEKEITIAKNKVNAVITSEPGFILNSNMEDSQAVALIGRVPVRIIGKVKKFDKIALSYIDGVGCVNNDAEYPVGIALESKDDSDEGLVICSVKLNLM